MPVPLAVREGEYFYWGPVNSYACVWIQIHLHMNNLHIHTIGVIVILLLVLRTFCIMWLRLALPYIIFHLYISIKRLRLFVKSKSMDLLSFLFLRSFLCVRLPYKDNLDLRVRRVYSYYLTRCPLSVLVTFGFKACDGTPDE